MDDDLEVAVPDRCWVEERRNDSRKWIFNYGKKLSILHPVTTTRDHFTDPEKLKIKTHEGKRKEILKKQILKEIMEDIAREQSAPDPIEDYCTSYDNHYQISGFQVKDKSEENSELHIKYPLYRSEAFSLWHQKIQNRNSGFSKIEGVSKVTNLTNPFTRNDSFSKPVTERLDDEII